MQSVARHARKESAGRIGQLVIDVEEANLPAVRQCCDFLIDLVHRRLEGHVLRSREKGRQDDRGVGCPLPEKGQDGLDVSYDVVDGRLVGGTAPGEVVGGGLQHDHAWREAFEFTVLQSP